MTSTGLSGRADWPGVGSDSGAVPIVACHECGEIQHESPIPVGRGARCLRCGSGLYRNHGDSIQLALVLDLSAMFLFIVANTFTFLTFKLEGREQAVALWSGGIAFWNEGFHALSAVVLLTCVVFPLIMLLAGLYVLLPMHLGARPPAAALACRALIFARHWAMLEVFLFGVIVTWVKMADLATLEFGIAVYAFVGLIILLVAADAALEPRDVWDRLAPQATSDLLDERLEGEMVCCHTCGQLFRVSEHAHGLACSRCGSALHRRKPNAIGRAWALSIAAAILYVPANVLPIMTVISFGQGSPSTIISGVIELIQVGMIPVALVVFLASITVPVLKLIGLAFLLISVQIRSVWRPRDRTLLYRIVESVGRWSMVDIYVIALLVALVTLDAIATIEAGPAATAFAAVVIITIFAAEAFDPRLIWDAVEERDGQVSRLRA